jgi:hypothetical protein
VPGSQVVDVNSIPGVSDITVSIDHVPLTNDIESLDCNLTKTTMSLPTSTTIGDPSDVYASERMVGATLTLTSQRDRSDDCKFESVELKRTVVAEVPDFIFVIRGNAGNSTAWLQIGATRCAYVGGADIPAVDAPFRANQAERGRDYHFSRCESGAEPGDKLYARMFALQLGDAGSKDTQVVDADLKLLYPIYSEEEIGNP